MANNDEMRTPSSNTKTGSGDGGRQRGRRKGSSLGDGIRSQLTWRKAVAPILTVGLVAGTLAFTGTLMPGSGGDDLSPAAGTGDSPVLPAESEPFETPEIVPTDTWANFYGVEAVLDGLPVSEGSVITAVDPQGVVCGSFTVVVPGSYGLMPVYGDDESTEAEEGAVPGDAIEFYIDGVPASASGPDEPVWTDFGDLRQVEAAAQR